jgi:hypothetical protein
LLKHADGALAALGDGGAPLRLGIELAGDGEDGIAQGLGIKATLRTISRTRLFTDQPLSRNFTARVSSSAWLAGLLPVVPKLSGVFTKPCPNSHCQTRFTITRAVSG